MAGLAPAMFATLRSMQKNETHPRLKPTNAALVLHKSSFPDFLWVTFWLNVGSIIGLSLALFMIIGTLYGGVYLPVLLMVRGIVTQGQVTGQVTRRQRRYNLHSYS